MKIDRSLSPYAIHFVIEDIGLPGLIDAYVVDLDDDSEHPHAQFVVLFPSHLGLPPFLFAPSESFERVPYEEVLARAVSTYRAQHQSQLNMLGGGAFQR